MSPRIDGLRRGNDAAGKNGLQIGGTKRDAGKRAENLFRLCAAQHALVARQQQNGVFTTRREDERRRAERREPSSRMDAGRAKPATTRPRSF